jgi:hypothetical protein
MHLRKPIYSSSLSRWHPDIPDLCSLVQDFMTFGLLAGHYAATVSNATFKREDFGKM